MRYFFVIIFIFMFSILGRTQVVPDDSASNYIGKTIVVYGKIIDGRYLVNSANKPTLLNMGGKFPNQKLTVVINGTDRVNFGYKPEELLLNKVIYVTGKVEMYKGKPQIAISSPFSISFSNPNPTPAVEAEVVKSKTKEKEKKANETVEVNKPETKIVNEKKVNKELAKDKKPVVNDDEQNAIVEKQKEKLKEKRVEIKEEKKEEIIKEKNEEPSTITTVALQEGAVISLLSNIKLRSGPGNKFTNAGKLTKGTEVIIISIAQDWIKVKEKKADVGAFAVTGYVNAEDLQ